MNVDTINIGHYRATSHGGRMFDLFNRETDKVISITHDEFKFISRNRDVPSCEEVYYGYVSRV